MLQQKSFEEDEGGGKLEIGGWRLEVGNCTSTGST